MLASNPNGDPDPFEFSLAKDIVELIVLTADDTFLTTLRSAVGSSRRLWHVPTSDKVSDLLVAGQVGILFLDVQALHETAGVFVSQIKRQFPDLIVVVAGDRSTEMLLASLISVGLVYRFIHKPMSPARARLFADAAVKRYEVQRDRAFRDVNPPPALLIGRRGLIVAGSLLLAAAVSLWAFQQRSGEDAIPLRPGTVVTQHIESQLLTRAAAALAANHLTPPAADNALDLYLQASARNPSDATARAGLTEVRERLLARAEDALLEERLDEAAAAIQTARKAGVESGRIAVLSSQLTRSRSLIKVFTPAADAKTDAAASEPAAALADILKRATERIQEHRLLEPDHDNARYYVQRALALAPTSLAVDATEESLAMALVAETHSAIERRDFPRAATTLDAARSIASPANVDILERLLRAAEADERDRPT